MFLLFRRRSFFTVLAFCILLVVGGFFMILHQQPAAPTLSWMMGEKTFLIDPGHGGTFPGASILPAKCILPFRQRK